MLESEEESRGRRHMLVLEGQFIVCSGQQEALLRTGSLLNRQCPVNVLIAWIKCLLGGGGETG